jgi:taurine dioxygenase
LLKEWSHPTDLTVKPLDAPLGAAITGVDLSQPLTTEARQQIVKAWHSHIILLFPGQELDGPAQLAFAEIFGTIKKRGRPNERRPDLEVQD